MKKIILFIATIITTGLISTNAQVTICDFESALSAGPAVIGGALTQTASVVANPAPDAINSSANVLKTNVYAIGGDPTGGKIDAVMFQFPSGTTFQANDYAAIKVNIYVTGGTPDYALKPRGKAGIWVDDSNSPTPGTWIGVVKNREDGGDGLALNQSGWMECYFDISGKTNTDLYDAIQIQMDWNDVRDQDLEIYFDDFVLVETIPDLIPTGIEDKTVSSAKIYYTNGLVKVQSEDLINEISVFDTTGRLVKKVKGQGLEQANISDLSNGLYIVSVQGEKQTYTGKILK